MRTRGWFSAARRALSLISFLLLFFFVIIVLCEKRSYLTKLDDDVRERSDDSQHLGAIDERLRLRGRFGDAAMFARWRRPRKMAKRERRRRGGPRKDK